MTTFNNYTQSELDKLVNKYSSLFGVDAASGVQFMQLLSNEEFNDLGKNKYNLTEQDIETINAAIRKKESIGYIDLLIKEIQTRSQTKINTSELSEEEFVGIMNQYANGGDIQELLAQAGFDTLERNYQSGAGRQVPLYEDGKMVMENGSPKMVPFNSYFADDFHYILNSLSDYDDILDFQRYLVENNVVSTDTFMGSEGEYSTALEGAIVSIMSFVDNEYTIGRGSEEWNSIMNQDTVFFNKKQHEDFILDENGVPIPNPKSQSKDEMLKLFNFGIKEINKDFQQFAAYEEQIADEQLINALKSQYQVLTPLQREDEVESWFEQKLGRKGSEKEIADWANNIALNYSSVFKTLVKDMQDLQETAGLRDFETSYLQTMGQQDLGPAKKTFSEMTDISSQLSQENALLQAEDRFEQQYGEQMESYEVGKQSIEQDKAILRMMYG